ncbi:MAG: phosphoenolpyruvate synthase [Candidatus Parcubacteria bacterium]|nr:phosphoenolpyruvate synthase [Candidatus Parcubacteria bacterium]
MKSKSKKYILWLKDLNLRDVPLVGGKNASLGEMHGSLSLKGVNIPDGFALSSFAFWHYLKSNNILNDLEQIFKGLDTEDIGKISEAGKKARTLILNAEFPDDLKKEILKSYRSLSGIYKETATDVAVRSSGTAEDMPDASFAGQFESFLNIRGEENLLKAVKNCYASLFNNRAIAYKAEKGFSQLKIALSVGVIKMVRSDVGSSGIIFTLDTETGFQNVVLINSIWGIGEMIVKGKITPDEFYVFKPTLKQGFKPIIMKNLGRKDKKYVFAEKGGLKEVEVPKDKQLQFSVSEKDILKLAEWACLIEEHYQKPEDIEWAKDGRTGELFIVQSRPETVHKLKTQKFYEEYEIKSKKPPILAGTAVGTKISSGQARVITDISHISQFKRGEILVTKMTDPDWVPAIRMAGGIITDEGGRTCHAAIVSRELGVPAIVGTKNGTKIINDGQILTMDCATGKGRVFSGKIPFSVKKYNLKRIPKIKTKIMVNLGVPEKAFKISFLPQDGVGLARQEFIITEKIKIHPLALYHFNGLKDKKIKKEIEAITIEHKDKKEYFIKELAEGIAQIAAAFWPKEVILRLSDFKTNEYRGLIGGSLFEGNEENPMLGFRGASRYIDPQFQPAFMMECQAISRVKREFGLNNISLMVPFCRTPEEGKRVLELMAKFGIARKSAKIYVMCEIPSNVILADKFLDVFDGMSIGSNDLSQLVLGIDRDNAKIASIADERNEAVKEMVRKAIKACRRRKKYIGICGQAPSDFPEFAEFLVKEGISSISLSPDSVIKTILSISKRKK